MQQVHGSKRELRVGGGGGGGAFVHRCSPAAGRRHKSLARQSKHLGCVLNKPSAASTLPILFTSQTLFWPATGGGRPGGPLGSQA